jgi:hypothetical protein
MGGEGGCKFRNSGGTEENVMGNFSPDIVQSGEDENHTLPYRGITDSGNVLVNLNLLILGRISSLLFLPLCAISHHSAEIQLRPQTLSPTAAQYTQL